MKFYEFTKLLLPKQFCWSPNLYGKSFSTIITVTKRNFKLFFNFVYIKKQIFKYWNEQNLIHNSCSVITYILEWMFFWFKISLITVTDVACQSIGQRLKRSLVSAQYSEWRSICYDPDTPLLLPPLTSVFSHTLIYFV